MREREEGEQDRQGVLASARETEIRVPISNSFRTAEVSELRNYSFLVNKRDNIMYRVHATRVNAASSTFFVSGQL